MFEKLSLGNTNLVRVMDVFEVSRVRDIQGIITVIYAASRFR